MKNLMLVMLLFLGTATSSQARNLYLNGIDISSARHQNLENVQVKIDGQGNIYISAPHYQVNEENTYIPLSRWDRRISGPQHKQGAKPIAKDNLEPASKDTEQNIESDQTKK